MTTPSPPPDLAPVVAAVVGPTASGKSALALAVARRLGADIVSVDSMQVYRGMDIGTAKPSAAEQAAVAHHGIDLASPEEDYTVSRFQTDIGAALSGLAAAGRPAVLVGGTGLYFQAVVDGFTIPPQFDEVRRTLDAEPDTAALHRRLTALDPVAAARMEPGNRRRVVRALEVTLGSGRPFSSFGPGVATFPPVPFPVVAVAWPRPELDTRIAARIDAQLAAGWIDEVRRLTSGATVLSRTARQALGYKELIDHLEGQRTLAETVELIRVRTRQFARRQERWFRRDPRVRWLAPGAGADDVVALARPDRSPA